MKHIFLASWELNFLQKLKLSLKKSKSWKSIPDEYTWLKKGCKWSEEKKKECLIEGSWMLHISILLFKAPLQSLWLNFLRDAHIHSTFQCDCPSQSSWLNFAFKNPISERRLAISTSYCLWNHLCCFSSKLCRI